MSDSSLVRVGVVAGYERRDWVSILGKFLTGIELVFGCDPKRKLVCRASLGGLWRDLIDGGWSCLSN